MKGKRCFCAQSGMFFDCFVLGIIFGDVLAYSVVHTCKRCKRWNLPYKLRVIRPNQVCVYIRNDNKVSSSGTIVRMMMFPMCRFRFTIRSA